MASARVKAFTLEQIPTNWLTDTVLCCAVLCCAVLIPLQYCECTDGSYIESKASALVWHYGDADPDFGNWQVCGTLGQ
jgi:hypothetical protein